MTTTDLPLLEFQPWCRDQDGDDPFSPEHRAAHKALRRWPGIPVGVPFERVIRVAVTDEGITTLVYGTEGTVVIGGEQLTKGPVGVELHLKIEEPLPPQVLQCIAHQQGQTAKETR